MAVLLLSHPHSSSSASAYAELAGVNLDLFLKHALQKLTVWFEKINRCHSCLEFKSVGAVIYIYGSGTVTDGRWDKGL